MPQEQKKVIKAVIFDMDGVLIDSEPFWHIAEKEIFQRVGLHLTTEDCLKSMGRRIDGVVAYWYEQHPWGDTPTQAEISAAIVQTVIQLIKAQGQAMAGVKDALAFFRQQGLKLAIASSSHMALIETVVQHLGIESYFDLLYSAEYEPYGKPHPGVYITTANKLGVSVESCVVIEDSLRGILAAKSAEMLCIAIPDPSLHDDPRLTIADWRLDSLNAITADFWHHINQS